MDELRQRLRSQALAHCRECSGAMDAAQAALQRLQADYPAEFCEDRLHLDDEMQRLQAEIDHWRQNAIDSLSLLLSLAGEEANGGRESAAADGAQVLERPLAGVRRM
jgi:hypothetical protein